MANGILYLVATPIGNMEDISARAVRILAGVDLVAAEDTRVSGRLLKLLGIKQPLISYYEHNKALRGGELLARLQAGENIALISDAGMPAISDPGAELVRQAIAAGIEVIGIPGPNAALSALVVSGLPTERFVFEGFLPREPAKRRAALHALAAEQRTLLFYEAPHRLLAALSDMAAAFGGERLAAASRELTKLHEETRRGTLTELVAYFGQVAPRGEFTLVVAGAPETIPYVPPEEELLQEMQALIVAGQGRKEAAKLLAAKYGLPVKQVYGLGLE